MNILDNLSLKQILVNGNYMQQAEFDQAEKDAAANHE